jgi:MOSC domain-containing protein YiiM
MAMRSSIEVPTWVGRVQAIFVASEASAPLSSLDEVLAVAGRGLEGDRYFERTGTYSATPGTGREVTLVESEAIEAVARDGIRLEPGATRRNIVTVGAPLSHLVGREFLVGEVRLRGMRLCEPCGHMSRLAGNHRGTVKAFTHRAGLRAEIVSGGPIRVGDPMRPAD